MINRSTNWSISELFDGSTELYVDELVSFYIIGLHECVTLVPEVNATGCREEGEEVEQREGENDKIAKVGVHSKAPCREKKGGGDTTQEYRTN